MSRRVGEKRRVGEGPVEFRRDQLSSEGTSESPCGREAPCGRGTS